MLTVLFHPFDTLGSSGPDLRAGWINEELAAARVAPFYRQVAYLPVFPALLVYCTVGCSSRGRTLRCQCYHEEYLGCNALHRFSLDD